MAKGISDDMQNLNRGLHKTRADFGNSPDDSAVALYLPEAIGFLHQQGLCNSVLDYGSGKGSLVQRLRKILPDRIKIDGYDPAVKEFETKPSKIYDLLTCLDVLEHIELKYIDSVIDEINNLTNSLCYVVIDLQPAIKTLPDGRNTHILLAPPEWWVAKFAHNFPCVISFPIKHLKGFDQKLVLCLAKNPRHIHAMYTFLVKLDIFNMRMIGGPSA